MQELEFSEIRSWCWPGVVWKTFWAFVRMVGEMNRRRGDPKYKRVKSNPWSSKLVYLHCVIRLATKEEEKN